MLIAIYYYICECYDTYLSWNCQRYSPNSSVPAFTDQELLTIYIYAVKEEEKFKVKSIYDYSRKYLSDWFPDLPSYQAFNRRLNRLGVLFPLLVGIFLEDADKQGINFQVSLLDSLPIITCSSKRSGKVARELTDKGFCATKSLHYYGAKLHGIGFRRPGRLPFPEYLSLSLASQHDLTALRPILPRLANRKLYGDKADSDKELKEALQKKIGATIFTPVKLVKGMSREQRQFIHAADKLFSTAVSKVRQPIESFFNWLIEKTDIQKASKVRSANGLIVHVFGKIAAAIANWIF